MTLNKQTTRREHTVSKTYFRPFTFSQQRIHAFDKETGRRNTPSIRSITVRDFFYDLPPDCLPPGIQDEQIVENALSSLEDVFARERDALLVKVETDGLTDY